MKWLIVRALVLSLIVGTLCAAAIGVGRLDHTPSPLQAVGLDLCAGEPCFRGIKPGMDWAALQSQFPDAIKSGSAQFGWPANTVGVRPIEIVPSEYQKFVRSISVSAEGDDTGSLPFSAADVIVLYGSPCRVYQDFSDGVPAVMVLDYQTMSVRTDIVVGDVRHPQDFRLQWNSPVTDLFITDDKVDRLGSCDTVVNKFNGQWSGFTSSKIYQRRNLAAIGKSDEPSGS